MLIRGSRPWLIALVGLCASWSCRCEQRSNEQEHTGVEGRAGLGNPITTSDTLGFIEQPGKVLPPFELSDSSGGVLSETQLIGKWSILFFGYTSCPDVCPDTLTRLKEVYAQLPEPATRFVQAVFISVDPTRDTPERLQAYLHHFDARFRGATADRSTLDSLTEAVGASYELPEHAQGTYTVGHTSALFVIDPEARRVGLFSSSAKPSQMARDLERLRQSYEPRVVVHDPWIRHAPPQAPALAGYFTLGNVTPAALTLIGASSPSFERVELHQTREADGMARMQAVEFVGAAAGERIEFSPGGYHLMLIGPKSPMQLDEKVDIQLQFRQRPPMTIQAEVRG